MSTAVPRSRHKGLQTGAASTRVAGSLQLHVQQVLVLVLVLVLP